MAPTPLVQILSPGACEALSAYNITKVVHLDRICEIGWPGGGGGGRITDMALGLAICNTNIGVCGLAQG